MTAEVVQLAHPLMGTRPIACPTQSLNATRRLCALRVQVSQLGQLYSERTVASQQQRYDDLAAMLQKLCQAANMFAEPWRPAGNASTMRVAPGAPAVRAVLAPPTGMPPASV